LKGVEWVERVAVTIKIPSWEGFGLFPPKPWHAKQDCKTARPPAFATSPAKDPDVEESFGWQSKTYLTTPILLFRVIF